jgi:hypothetical protein
MPHDEDLHIEICDKIFDISIDGHGGPGVAGATGATGATGPKGDTGSCSTVWGGITGDINNQTDLKDALDAKQDKIVFDYDYQTYII